MRTNIFLTGVILGFLSLVSGCGGGPDVGTVSGVVTLDGAPQPNLIVSFIPQGGGQAAIGRTDESGKYELYRRGEEGAVVGVYSVSITSVSEASDEPMEEAEAMTSDSDAYMEQAMGSAASDYNQAMTKEKIPAKYNSATTLTETVESGSQTIDFTLTSQ